jgi:bifunctional ADP-heptose synthase (sugar kinase/adenylyltransferase)
VGRFIQHQRQSPECPECPIGDQERREVHLGLAGNVARWARLLSGRRTRLHCLLGRQGSEAALIQSLARQADVGICYALQRQVGINTVKERVYLQRPGDRYRQVVRLDRDSDLTLQPPDVAGLLENLRNSLRCTPTPPVLVMVDYDKGMFTGDPGAQLVERLGAFVEEHRLLAVVNSKQPARWAQFPADALVCNCHEMDAAWPGFIDEPAWSWPRLAANLVLVTLGEFGVAAYRAVGTGCGGLRTFVTTGLHRSRATEVVDVTGAGDAFLAAIAVQLSHPAAPHPHGTEVSYDALSVLVGVGQDKAALCCRQYGVGSPIAETPT